MRKPTRKSLRNRLDTAWRKYIYKRDGFKCQRCSRSKEQGYVLNAHHIITKGSSGLAGRWDVDNGVTVCFRCHQLDYIALGDFCKDFLKRKKMDYYELRDKYKASVYKPTLSDLQIKLDILEKL